MIVVRDLISVACSIYSKGWDSSLSHTYKICLRSYIAWIKNTIEEKSRRKKSKIFQILGLHGQMVHIFERMHVNKFPLEGEKEKKEKERGKKGVGRGDRGRERKKGTCFSLLCRSTFAKSWPIAELPAGPPSVFPCRAQVSVDTVASVRGNEACSGALLGIKHFFLLKTGFKSEIWTLKH